MSIKTRSEAKIPTEASKRLVQDAIARVKPDVDALNELYNIYANNHKTRLAFDIDYVQHYVPTGSAIMEIGSIPPILTTAIGSLGYKIRGIDISPERFQTVISSMALDITKADIETEKLPFSSNAFNAVTFNEVFEHLRINPIQTMGEIFRILKPCGVLLLSTPNLTSLRGWVDFIFKNKAPGNIFNEYLKLQKLGHMGHVREYTPVEVCDFLQKIGFEIEEVIYRGTFTPRSFWKRSIVSMILVGFPRFRPFFSVVARKPA